jgi:hypothetical protein
MKSFNPKEIAIFIAIIITTFIDTTAYCQWQNKPYNFPYQPKSESWKTLKSVDEFYLKSQIPLKVLNDLTTEALAVSCLNYPMLGIINAHNSQQAGFEFLKEKFYGFDSLLNRKDVINVLLNLYKKANPIDFRKDWSMHDQVSYMSSLQCLEILLAQDKILEKMNKNQVKQLFEESLIKYDAKKSQLEIYSSIGLEQTLWAATKLLMKSGQLSNHQNIHEFVKGGSHAREEDLNFFVDELRKLSK